MFFQNAKTDLHHHKDLLWKFQTLTNCKRADFTIHKHGDLDALGCRKAVTSQNTLDDEKQIA
jgi:hypothetical protein